MFSRPTMLLLEELATINEALDAHMNTLRK